MIKDMYYMVDFILELIFIKIVTCCKKDCVNKKKIELSSIVIEAIGTVFFFYEELLRI